MLLGNGRLNLAMSADRHWTHPREVSRTGMALASCGFAAMLLVAVTALAQDAAKPAAPPAASPPASHGFFDTILHWFGSQSAKFNSNLKDAGSQVENFGREAGIAAKSTVDTAKGAADAVARMSSARVLNGHEKCTVAPNGAPDCVSAATNICKAKGFNSGKSLDMTTAEVCPPQVLLSGRSSGPECHDETFVSRVLCQ